MLFYDSGFLTNELIDKWSAKAEELYKDAFKGKDHPGIAVLLAILTRISAPCNERFLSAGRASYVSL